MSAANVLEFQDLQRVTGYRRRSDVERILHKQGIKVFQGKDGPWTTTDLINQAGGLKLDDGQDTYDPSIV